MILCASIFICFVIMLNPLEHVVTEINPNIVINYSLFLMSLDLNHLMVSTFVSKLGLFFFVFSS